MISLAAVAMTVIALIDSPSTTAAPASPAEAVVAGPEPLPEGRARAYATSNVRLRPDPGAEVIAIVPGSHEVELLARTPSSEWVRVAYPAGSTVQGWVPASRLEFDPAALAALPEAAEATASSSRAPGSSASGALPDLVVDDVFLLQDGRMSVDIRNVGEGALVDAAIPLHVTRASGEIVGVLEVGPTTLIGGASATVVTPIVVRSTGTYLLHLDRADTIPEARESNNTFSALLVVGGP